MENISNPKIHWTIFITLLASSYILSSVMAQSQNGRPIADAGLPRYAGPDPIVLDGTGSYDPDNSGTLSYTWRHISGPAVTITDANTATPTISSFVQTEEIQECKFELVVSDGELTSLPDTVKIIVVPNFSENILRLANDSFDPNKPTFIWFAGGDCIVRTPYDETFPSVWLNKTNIIHFPYYEPDPNYTPGDVDAPRTYYRCGDMIIAYLSSAAPDYHQPIQSGGWSTGGQPAIDVGIHLNLTYSDARYAVNRVTLVDARACRDFSDSIRQFLDSAVDGEQCWIDNHRGNTDGPFPSWPSFYPNVLRVGLSLSHMGVQTWYANSLTNSDMNQFNHGVVGGAYWSVMGPGKNLQLASTPGVETYSFKWVGTESSGYMDFWDEPNHPGRLPEPVILVGPENGAFVDANRAVFSCEESENAVGYQLLFGSEPYRVMDYLLISDTPSPPVGTISEFPFEQTWWTVKVYDSFGSTIYADPRWINAAIVSPPMSIPTYGKYGGGLGETNYPYLIYTADHLNAIGAEPNDWDKHIKLMADIDLSGYSYDAALIAADVDPCEPGFQGISFTGVLDGNGHKISNLTITGGDYVGLFGQTELGAEIKNLGVIDVNIAGSDYVGGLVGFSKGNISTSYCTGTISGDQRVGGITGRNWTNNITACYSTATITANSDAGGIAANNYGSITNCYNTGAISSYRDAAGLVGENYGTIDKCYSVGAVSGDSRPGGLVSANWQDSIITSSFWDVETSGQSTSDGGTGKTTAEMQTAGTFLDAGWDFVDEKANGTEDIWRILEGRDYPRLAWELTE